MKTRKMISTMFVFLLLTALSFTAGNAFAQAKSGTKMTHDYCMMKDGKMMLMKSGAMMPMTKNMTMKNGTKVMTDGECIMKDGTKMKMKEGECMDMNGSMDMCNMMNKDSKSTNEMNSKTHDMANYACPMHPEITSDKPGKCSKCGMDMVEKK